MRIAILSDIHGNIGALRAVINDARRRGYDQMFCLGDIVGYGSHPKDCLDVIKETCSEVIRGNHEEMVVNFNTWNSKLNNELALVGLRYSLGQLSVEDLAFLNSISSKKKIPHLNLTLAHASFSDPAWGYIEDQNRARTEMGFLATKLGFVGHTHIPVVYNMDLPNLSDPIWCSEAVNSSLDSITKCIINVGSVGQPRDRNPKASYGILELTKTKVKYCNLRVEYNISQAAKYIRNAGLPRRTASRLFEGR